MSKMTVEKIRCPKCRLENDFNMWHSVNVTLDKEMKEKILNGEVFHFKCSECGYESQVFYPLLYHDMEKKLMVYMLHDDEHQVKEAAAFMSGITDTDNELDIKKYSEEYTNRIVTTIHELQEKIYISDAGYDDRIIEIMKVIFLAMTAEKTPDQRVDEILFDNDNEKGHAIRFIEKGKCFGSIAVSEKVYNDIMERFGEKIEKNPDRYFIYDFNWARGMMR